MYYKSRIRVNAMLFDSIINVMICGSSSCAHMSNSISTSSSYTRRIPAYTLIYFYFFLLVVSDVISETTVFLSRLGWVF